MTTGAVEMTRSRRWTRPDLLKAGVDEYVTIGELARLMECRRNTLYRRIDSKRQHLPAIRHVSWVVYPLVALALIDGATTEQLEAVHEACRDLRPTDEILAIWRGRSMRGAA